MAGRACPDPRSATIESLEASDAAFLSRVRADLDSFSSEQCEKAAILDRESRNEMHSIYCEKVKEILEFREKEIASFYEETEAKNKRLVKKLAGELRSINSETLSSFSDDNPENDHSEIAGSLERAVMKAVEARTISLSQQLMGELEALQRRASHSDYYKEIILTFLRRCERIDLSGQAKMRLRMQFSDECFLTVMSEKDRIFREKFVKMTALPSCSDKEQAFRLEERTAERDSHVTMHRLKQEDFATDFIEDNAKANQSDIVWLMDLNLSLIGTDILNEKYAEDNEPATTTATATATAKATAPAVMARGGCGQDGDIRNWITPTAAADSLMRMSDRSRVRPPPPRSEAERAMDDVLDQMTYTRPLHSSSTMHFTDIADPADEEVTPVILTR